MVPGARLQSNPRRSELDQERPTSLEWDSSPSPGNEGAWRHLERPRRYDFGMPISIVIPAHNEEDVIERCLTALAPTSAPEDLEVVVVCNGCNGPNGRTRPHVRCPGRRDADRVEDSGHQPR